MELKDIFRDSKDMTDREIDRKFDEFLINNRERFRFVDDNNKALIKDLISKYKEKARDGIKVSSSTIRRDTHDIWKNRRELGLRENDLDLIRDLLSSAGGR